LSDALFYFAEIATQEHRSAALVSDILERKGFALTRGICGFPTGFIARWGSGSPVIALQLGYDAEPEASQYPSALRRPLVRGAPGHNKGRNVTAAATIAAAIAIAEALKSRPQSARLVVFGVPGESVRAARSFYLRDGHFDQVDVSFCTRLGDDFRTDYGVLEPAAMSVLVKFEPQPHSAIGVPLRRPKAHDGIFAFEAGLAQHREHLLPQCTIYRSDESESRVPHRSDCAEWSIRAPTASALKTIFGEVCRIAQGAGMMTECVGQVAVASAVWPLRGNEALAKLAQRNLRAIGMPQWTLKEVDFATSLQRESRVEALGLRKIATPLAQLAAQSTSPHDAGDISWVVPSACVQVPGAIPGIPLGHWATAAASATSIGYRAACVGAMAVAASVMDLVEEPPLIRAVKDVFEKEVGVTPYASLLPKESKPFTNIYADEMAKYRAAMELHYRPEVPRF
jgi:aminobenzoyl-glutamate utilization protein B